MPQKPIVKRVRFSSTDPGVRGVSGSLWSILSPTERERANRLITEGMSPERMEGVYTEIIRNRDQRVILKANDNDPNPRTQSNDSRS